MIALHRKPPDGALSEAAKKANRSVNGKVILGVSVWCWWGSCGDPGRGRVQICHKGAPGWDRPRRKARNINDSLPAFRLDPGLCGRFGQLAPLRALWGGRLPASARSMMSTPARAPARRAVVDRAGAPFDRAGPARAPPRAPRRRPDPRDRHLTHENVPLADDLAGYPAISAVKWRSRGLPGDLADRRRHDMRDAVSLCGMASPGEPQDGCPRPARRRPGPAGRRARLTGVRLSRCR